MDVNEVKSDRPTAYEMSVPDDTPHSTKGHIGYRCGGCALVSEIQIRIASDGGEYWQNKQLLWQEECDELQNQFDKDVASHWPEHKAIGCEDCPKVYEMPPKPMPPFERALRQNAE